MLLMVKLDTNMRNYKIEYTGFRNKFVINFGKTIKSETKLCSFVYPYSAIKYSKLKKISNKKDKYLYNFAICAIFKNEALYLKEWIEYHKFIGVDKIYLYNNNSTDNYYEVLKPYIKEKFVILKNCPGKERQMDAYNDCLMRYKYKAKYIAFIDIDEFLFEKNNKLLEKVNHIFDKNSNIAGVQLNWKIFGSSHQEKYVDEPVTKRFVYSSNKDFSVNKHTKSIVNPRKVVCIANPHYAIYVENYYAVNVDGKIISNNAMNEDVNDNLRVNHYFTKSKDEFVLKIQRGTADGYPIRSMELFDSHDKNDVYDDSMKLFYENYKK